MIVEEIKFMKGSEHMEEIKNLICVEVNIDGETEVFDRPSDIFEALNIPDTMEYHEAKVGIIQKLLVFGEIDLSPAYKGHTVKLRVVYENV